MAYVVSDRVKETTTTTGTGSLTLAGAVTGFKTFLSGVGNSNTTTYVIVDATGAQWEVGLGTLSGGTTLARTMIYANSSGTTSALSLSAGTKSVFVSMSADVRNFNTSLGTALGFSPNLYQYNTVIGYGATVSANYATAIGQYAAAGGDNDVALGGGASAAGGGSTALGQQASASVSTATAVGRTATATNSGAVAVGNGSNASGSVSVGIGNGANASGDFSVALGNVAAPNSEQLSSRMRLNPGGVTGVAVKWDSTTKEIYADSTGGGGGGVTSIIAGTNITISSTGPGGTGAVTINASTTPAGPNWATYQDNDMSPLALSLATPSATTSSPNATWFFSPGASPSSPSWGFMGSPFGGIGNTYSTTSYPVTSPITGGSFSGAAVCFFPSYQSDAGTMSTMTVTSFSSPYSNFSSSISIGGGWPVFGSTRYGHCIAVISGSFVSSFTASPGCTVAASFYDIANNYTYIFINADSAAVSNINGGMPFGTLGGSSASYQLLFWYNY